MKESLINRFSYPVLLSIAVCIVLFQGSCTKLCDNGYEGDKCDVPVRQKFIGVWSAVDNPGNLQYTDTISIGTGLLDVVISNGFAQNYFANPVKATVSGNQVSIAKQNPDNDSLYVQGTGSIDNGTLTWNYTLINNTDSPQISTSYTGVWSK